jgi:hypothetical protein
MNPVSHLLVLGRPKKSKIITELRRGASAYLPPACLGGELILAMREVVRNVIAYTSRNSSRREGRRRRKSLVSRPVDRRSG